MIERALAAWFETVARTAPWLLAVAALLTVCSGWYAGARLGVNTDTADMISDRLPWRQTYIGYTQDFPQEVDTVLVVVKGRTPEQAERAAARLAGALELETQHVQSVYRFGAEAYFERNGLLFLEPDALETLTDRLARVQPLLAMLAADPSSNGLAGLLEQVEEQADPGLERELQPLLDAVARAALEVGAYSVSWRELMLERDSASAEARADRLRFIEVKPVLDFDALLPAGEMIARIRALTRELGLEENQGVQVRLTGEVAMGHEEIELVSRGAAVGAIAALIMVSLVLGIGVRSWQLVLASVATLVVGLVWTAAYAAATVGQLNLISVAFAVLYIGLGIDAAIHVCLRYRELLYEAVADPPAARVRAALRGTGARVGPPLALCSITTGAGFFAFVPTDFAGLSELGVIAGGGMLISFTASVTMLPAMLAVLPVPRLLPRVDASARRERRLDTLLGSTSPRRVLLGAAAVALAGLAALPFARFDENPLNLQPSDGEAASTFRSLLEDSATSPWWMVVSARDAAEVAQAKSRLKALDVVDEVISVEDFVPDRQEEKLDRVEALDLVLGPALQDRPETTGLAAAPAGLDGLREASRLLAARPGGAAAARLVDALDQLAALLRSDPNAAGARLAAFERGLFENLYGELNRLERALGADVVALEDLPPELYGRWVNEAGRRLLRILPRDDLNDADARRRFVAAVTDAVPQATGLPMVYVGAGRAVVAAFQQAFATAALLIAGLLWLAMRRLDDVLRVLGLLALASLATVGMMVVLDLPFNFANVIALPLLLGVGVDGGIHMVRRAREARPDDAQAFGQGLLATSTARAVLVSALTTVAGFGNLAFSPHPGTASMGLVLTIGMAMTLAATLLVLPALIRIGKS